MNNFHTESFSLAFLVVKLFKFVVVNLVLEFPVFLDHREIDCSPGGAKSELSGLKFCKVTRKTALTLSLVVPTL